MASAIFEEALHRVPEETRIFAGLSLGFFDRVHLLLEERGMTEHDLARAMNISPLEMASMLSLGHNVSLRTLAQMQAVLGEPIMSMPDAQERELMHV